MAEKLKSWVENHVKKYDQFSIGTLSNLLFFREEIRPIIRNPNFLMSPADGVLLYNKIVMPDEDVVEIKGETYTVNEVLGGADLDVPCLVSGVFMTFYDIHVNRIPMDGILGYEFINSIKSRNFPMIMTERGLFKDDLKYALRNSEYMKNNERMICEVYNNKIDYSVHMALIADEDVDVISMFSHNQNDLYAQGDRFAFIRWGSQVDMICPIYKDAEFIPIPILKEGYHVKAAEDSLVELIWKDDPQYGEVLNTPEYAEIKKYLEG